VWGRRFLDRRHSVRHAADWLNVAHDELLSFSRIQRAEAACGRCHHQSTVPEALAREIRESVAATTALRSSEKRENEVLGMTVSPAPPAATGPPAGPGARTACTGPAPGWTCPSRAPPPQHRIQSQHDTSQSQPSCQHEQERPDLEFGVAIGAAAPHGSPTRGCRAGGGGRGRPSPSSTLFLGSRRPQCDKRVAHH
jgi:hypothetical protein